uniref:Bifunctional inhibitor/plant lipid transfer protein/seed storage helical domain-containing protein n=1 Tax=Oryza glumipatula TaxID=40148 RepID=A0A0E0AHA1_9ORYZ
MADHHRYGSVYPRPTLPAKNRLPDVAAPMLPDNSEAPARWLRRSRCPALSHLLVGMYKELCAVTDGKPMDEVFPGCQRDNVKCVAASLLALCNVDIPIGISGVY